MLLKQEAIDLIKQFETQNYIINNEVGYIMQASRTLPVGTHGHLPSDNTGVFEWFRQNCNSYLKKQKSHAFYLSM